jgi:hypothetical protein
MMFNVGDRVRLKAAEIKGGALTVLNNYFKIRSMPEVVEDHIFTITDVAGRFVSVDSRGDYPGWNASRFELVEEAPENLKKRLIETAKHLHEVGFDIDVVLPIVQRALGCNRGAARVFVERDFVDELRVGDPVLISGYSNKEAGYILGVYVHNGRKFYWVLTSNEPCTYYEESLRRDWSREPRK